MNIPSFRGHLPLLLGLFASPAVLGASLSYNGFSASDFPTDLTLSGNAQLAGSVVRLTPASENMAGGLFTTDKAALGALKSFSTYFQFQITEATGADFGGDGPGADGVVFVMQTQNDQLGSVGGGIGYDGLTQSFAVEFDTFYNDFFEEPDGNHVGININGNMISLATASETGKRFNDGDLWNAWIDYDGDAQTVEIRWSTEEERPLSSQLTYGIDLSGIFGSGVEGHFGFTSATGGALENHDILKWTLEDSYDITAVPEPGSAVTLAVLLTSSVLSHRRRGKKKA